MLKGMVQKVVGTRFQREMKRLQPIVDEIKIHEARLAEVTEADLKEQTARFRDRIRERTQKLEDEIEKLREIEGVLHVDVVFAEFADLLPDEDAASPNPTDERMSRPGEPRIEMEPESWS